MRIKGALLIGTMLMVLNVLAQQTPLNYFTLTNKKVLWLSFDQKDTLREGCEHEDPVFRSNDFTMHLGNLGLPHYNLNFGYGAGTDPSLAENVFRLYAFDHNTIPFYVLDTIAYTNIRFGSGFSKTRRMIELEHAQTLGDFSYGVNLKAYNSEGKYFAQHARDLALNTYIYYNKKESPYSALVSYIYNRQHVDENGGILHDSIFEENIEPNRTGIEVRMTQAHSSLKEHNILYQHSFRLWEHGGDKAWNNMYVSHSYSYLYNKNDFSDQAPDSLYYAAFANSYLSDRTMFRYNNMRNIVQLSNFNDLTGVHSPIEVAAGLKFHNIASRNESADTIGRKIEWMGYFASSRIHFKDIELTAQYEYLDKDYVFQAGFSFPFDSIHHGNVSFNFSVFEAYPSEVPCVLNQNPDFTAEDGITMELNASWHGYHLMGGYYRINHYSYFTTDGLVAQQDVEVLQAKFNKFFRLGRFALDSRFCVQHIKSESITLPEFMTKQTLYYAQPLFHRALLAQIGVAVNYSTEYTSPVYLPMIHQFAWGGDKQIGNYMLSDIFLTMYIRQVDITLKCSHFLSGALGYTYYGAQGYPLADRAIALAVNWRFND